MKNLINWALRIVPAVILLQTLYFKFSAAPESVYIFSTLGLEPWGRIGIGIGELIISILLFVPRTTWVGALGGIALMSGAVFFHLTKLGIKVLDDGGTLFVLAVVVLLLCLINLMRQKEYFLSFVEALRGKKV